MSDQPQERSTTRAHEANSLGLLGTPRALARIAVTAYWRSARWTVVTSARASKRVMSAAVNGQSSAELFRSTRDEVRDYARRFLGLSPGDEEEQGETGLSEAQRKEAAKSLRERGAELLRRSADVNFEEDAHPAYARILDQLAPDEGRVLRLLMVEGPQPSVDVRAGLVPLKVTTDLVAPGLNMIGAEAGCRHLEDVPAYLNNLFRLGLIWFSSEPVDDQARYQVLEAQPEVGDALKRAGRAHTVRRSVELTPFGKDFCRLCLPTSAGDVGEPDAGEHGNSVG